MTKILNNYFIKEKTILPKQKELSILEMLSLAWMPPSNVHPEFLRLFTIKFQ